MPHDKAGGYDRPSLVWFGRLVLPLLFRLLARTTNQPGTRYTTGVQQYMYSPKRQSKNATLNRSTAVVAAAAVAAVCLGALPDVGLKPSAAAFPVKKRAFQCKNSRVRISPVMPPHMPHTVSTLH